MSRLDGKIAVVTGGARGIGDVLERDSSYSTGAGFIADGGETAGPIRQLRLPRRRAVGAGR